jgi:hypothetical protein
MILFAKTPIPGRVKTRLIGRLSPEQAAALHEAMVRDAWQRLGPLGPIELHTDEETVAWEGIGPRRLQAEGDLGRRMLGAFEHALNDGYGLALIVGSDAPGLPAAHIAALLESAADVALGPTADGGYYAIGCRRPHPRMFEGVRWSTPHALADTVAACARCGLSVHVGPAWFDIDEPADLERLRDYPPLAGFVP